MYELGCQSVKLINSGDFLYLPSFAQDLNDIEVLIPLSHKVIYLVEVIK